MVASWPFVLATFNEAKTTEDNIPTTAIPIITNNIIKIHLTSPPSCPAYIPFLFFTPTNVDLHFGHFHV